MIEQIVQSDEIPMTPAEKAREEFSSRLTSAVENAGWKVYGAGKRLADLTKTTPKAASKWLKAEAMPGHEKILVIASELNVRAEWLEYGVGSRTEEEMFSSEEGHSQYSVNTTNPWTEPVKVAAQSLSAGHGANEEGMSCADEYEGEEEVDISRLHNLGIQPGCARIVKIKGESMYPTLWDGDKAIADTYVPHLVSGKIYAFYFDGELKVKRFTKRMDGNWVISSDNKDDPSLMDEVVSPNSTQQLHMIGLIKDLYSRRF